MLSLENFIRLFSWPSVISTTHLMLTILLLMPLTGCSNDGAGGQPISSLSTPTDGTEDMDVDQAPAATESPSGLDKDPTITTISTPDGATAHVTWEPPSGFNVAGYSIHYGKRSLDEPRAQEANSEAITFEESIQEDSLPEEPSLCSQGEGLTVTDSAAMIAGLEPDSRYIFVIRAFNETESLCSNEIAVVTPAAQS